MSHHFNLNRFFPKLVLDFGFMDGRWLSLSVEGLLPSLVKKVKDDYELRVISANGTCNCLPSYQKGFGRTEDEDSFKEKSKKIKVFYLVLRTHEHHIQIFEVPTASILFYGGKLNKKDLKELLPEEASIWLN